MKSRALLHLRSLGTAPFRRGGALQSQTQTLAALGHRAGSASCRGERGLRGRTVRCARAVRALCEKLAVLHHREFGKFRRLKGRH